MDPTPLIVFILVVLSVVLCVIKDIRITIPKTQISITVDYAAPPLVGIGVLLAAQSLSLGDVLRGGLLGDENIQPFAIIILFNALAYLCVSLDLTGILAYIALKVAQKAGSSAFRLFVYFYLLSAIFTVFTSNDIVILTLTPIIYYCSYATQMSPMPYLFGQFFAANICSLVLLIGNPTNIIVGEANHLTFADYSMWMIAVAFVATASAFFVLYYIFRSELNRTFVPPELNPQASLKDKRGAVFHSVVLIITLLSLSVAPFLRAPLWVICAIAAGVVFVYNSCNWPWNITVPTQVDLEGGSPETGVIKSSKAPQSPMKVDNEQTRLLDNNNSIQSNSNGSVEEDPTKVSNPFGDNSPMPTLKKSIEMLPWRIVPFVFGMFTLVEGMRLSGWIDNMADKLVACIPPEGGAFAVFVSAYLMTSVTILLSNLINNQPATILLTRVIISPGFLALPEAVRSVGMFGVILGSNLGANFTLIGALAGIMFAKILSEKGITLGYLEFAKQGFKVMPIVTALSAGILFVEHLAKV